MLFALTGVKMQRLLRSRMVARALGSSPSTWTNMSWSQRGWPMSWSRSLRVSAAMNTRLFRNLEICLTTHCLHRELPSEGRTRSHLRGRNSHFKRNSRDCEFRSRAKDFLMQILRRVQDVFISRKLLGFKVTSMWAVLHCYTCWQ